MEKKSISERFWEKVNKIPDGCWIWTAAKRGQNSYGAFRLSKKDGDIAAHRYSYELRNGSIPEGMIVCHTCDVPACVNPDHLFIGTHQDNAIDRQSKKRSKSFTKLTEDQAKEIKSSSESQSKLATKYKVSRRTIASIQYGETWKNIEDVNLVTKECICYICGASSKKSIHIDMNYSYRRINDELCLKCDRGIKLFNHNTERLKRAILFICK